MPGARRSSSSRMPVSVLIGPGRGTPVRTSVWKLSSSSRPRTRTAPISQIRDERAESPVVSRSKTTSSASSSSGSSGTEASAIDGPAPGQPAVTFDEVGDERAGEAVGRAPQREDVRGRLGRGDRPAASPRAAPRAGRPRRRPAAWRVMQPERMFAVKRAGTAGDQALSPAMRASASATSIGRTIFVASEAADLLERVEVLEPHRVRVDGLRDLEDLREREREALGAEDRRLPVALGRQDLGLLVALGDRDGRLLCALGLGDDGAPRPLGRHLPGHRVLDVRRRRDLAQLDVRDLHAPALGHLVELRLQDDVHLVALREDVVERHVADDAAQRRGRDVLGGAGEVLDLDDGVDGVDDAVEDDEVDRDRRVVLRDPGLPRDLQVLLAQVDEHRPVDHRDQEDDPGSLRPDHAAEAEDDVALVLADDADAQVEEDEQRRDRDDRADDCGEHVAETLVPGLGAPGARHLGLRVSVRCTADEVEGRCRLVRGQSSRTRGRPALRCRGCDSARSSSGCGR